MSGKGWKFKGKVLKDIYGDSFNENDELEVVMKKDEWVEGNLIWNNGDPFIVGDVIESCEEYISLDFWYPVVPESVYMIMGTITGGTDE